MNLGLRIAVITACGWLAGCASTSPGNEPRSARQNAAGYNLQLGVAYLQQGNLGFAKEKLERSEQQNPRDPALHTALGLLYERLGDGRKADRHYATALRLAPADPDVQNNYAVYLCKNGRIDDGVKRFEEAANNALYRTPEAAYTNAGVCQRSDRRYDDAARSFTRALTLRPNYGEAAYQLADMRLEQGDVAQARTILDRFMSSFRPTPDLLYLGVRVERAGGDRVAEERYARKLRIDFPDSEQARALSAPARNPG